MKHFSQILFFTAAVFGQQSPRRDTWFQITDRPGSSVVRQEFISGTHAINNVAGARRIFFASSSGLSTSVGVFETLTGAAGSEVFRNRLDDIGVRTKGAVRAEGGSGYFEFFADPAGTVNVSVRAPNNMSAGCLYHDGAGVSSWQPCAVGDFVTLDTAQTITGAKIFKGSITVEDTLSSVDRSVIGLGNLSLNTAGGHNRVFMASSSALDGSTGIIRVMTGPAGSESIVAAMEAGGVNVNSPATYRYNGTSGASITCGFGQYPNALQLQGGIATSATCTTLPTGGGDMLLGTAQTITGTKTFSSGVALRFVDGFGLEKGSLTNASWVFGDYAAGGRGVQISNSGVQIKNTSGQLVFEAGTAGGLSVWDSGLGVALSGLSMTCSVGQTVRQPKYVQGVLVSGGCGI